MPWSLLERGQSRRRPRAGEHRVLVRVLAVTKRDLLGAEPRRDPIQEEAARQAEVRGQRLRDRRVVRGGVPERLDREAAAERLVQFAGLERRQHGGVVVGIHDDGHVAVVLGRGAHERWPADVDVLDHLGGRHARPGGRRGERVEVHRHDGDGRNAPLVEHGSVRGVVQVGEDAGVDLGVERLDAAAEDLGRPGQLADLAHGDAGGAQHAGGSAGGEDLEALRDETARKAFKAALVGNRDEGLALHGAEALPSRPESYPVATGDPAPGRRRETRPTRPGWRSRTRRG